MAAFPRQRQKMRPRANRPPPPCPNATFVPNPETAGDCPGSDGNRPAPAWMPISRRRPAGRFVSEGKKFPGCYCFGGAETFSAGPICQIIDILICGASKFSVASYGGSFQDGYSGKNRVLAAGADSEDAPRRRGDGRGGRRRRRKNKRLAWYGICKRCFPMM